jgi:hypothetical protein
MPKGRIYNEPDDKNATDFNVIENNPENFVGNNVEKNYV